MSDETEKLLKALRTHDHGLAKLDSATSLARALEGGSSARALARLTESLPHERLLKAMESLTLRDNATLQLQETFRKFEEQRSAMRLALGPLEDFRRLGDLGASSFTNTHSALALARLEEQFRLPKLPEISALAESAFRKFATVSLSSAAGLEAAMARMHTPWLDRANELQSAQSFAAIQNIGVALGTANAFADNVSDLIRKNLGDWRDEIKWPQEIFEDISARSAFYEERGFNPALTIIPSPAFEESVEIAELDEAPPKIIEIEDYEIPASDPVEETAFLRTHAAQGRLLRFEHHMRRFIDGQMKAAFGEHWIKHQVDGDTRKKWQDKKKEAEERGGREHPLIDYADFTDYEKIILRNDNWSKVFQPVFGNKDSTRESLQRLHPVRLCSYHARLISQDDEIMLFIEVKRILIAIGVLKRGK